MCYKNAPTHRAISWLLVYLVKNRELLNKECMIWSVSLLLILGCSCVFMFMHLLTQFVYLFFFFTGLQTCLSLIIWGMFHFCCINSFLSVTLKVFFSLLPRLHPSRSRWRYLKFCDHRASVIIVCLYCWGLLLRSHFIFCGQAVVS